MTKDEASSSLIYAARAAQIDVGRCTAIINESDGFIDVHIADATDDECVRFVVEAYKLFPATVHIQVEPR